MSACVMGEIGEREATFRAISLAELIETPRRAGPRPR
jgi:hypothetical protein